MPKLTEVVENGDLQTADHVVGIVAGKVSRIPVGDVAKQMKRYDLPFSDSTEIDLAATQVYRYSVTGNIELTIANPPAADRAMTAVIIFEGSAGSVTWPENITWNEDIAPVLATNLTVVTLLWVGDKFLGNVSFKQ